MFTDIVDLREFYQGPPGQAARRILRAHVGELWPQVAGERVLVIGYGTPLLRPWLDQARAVYAFMPAQQGAAFWPREGPNVSALVDAGALPLPDACIDRVILLHALESLPDAACLLREVWRVMKGGARLLTIVPNRRGIWAHSDLTPFGNGQPFSSSQIKRALYQQGFLIERRRYALYMPPVSSRLLLSLADRVERIGRALFPAFGGVLIVEAGKQLYAPRGEKKSLRNRLLLPLPTLPASPLPAGRIQSPAA